VVVQQCAMAPAHPTSEMPHTELNEWAWVTTWQRCVCQQKEAIACYGHEEVK